MKQEEIFTNPYLCFKCDYVAEIPIGKSLDTMQCEMCSFDDLAYAIHIHAGTRKRWISIEDSSKWKKSKRLNKSLKNDVSRNELWTTRLDSITDQIFDYMNNSDASENFPIYRVDYARTSGKTLRLENKRVAKSTKRGSIRGELYEVFFLKAVDNIENIERCLESYKIPSSEKYSRPDALISFDSGIKYPVEFKTVGADDFKLNKIGKHLGQSHAQGTTLSKLNVSEGNLSMLIICCPEKRVYCSLLIDDRIRGRIRHLKGKPSIKRQSRERNRKRQEERARKKK